MLEFYFLGDLSRTMSDHVGHSRTLTEVFFREKSIAPCDGSMDLWESGGLKIGLWRKQVRSNICVILNVALHGRITSDSESH